MALCGRVGFISRLVLWTDSLDKDKTQHIGMQLNATSVGPGPDLLGLKCYLAWGGRGGGWGAGAKGRAGPGLRPFRPGLGEAGGGVGKGRGQGWPGARDGQSAQPSMKLRSNKAKGPDNSQN